MTTHTVVHVYDGNTFKVRPDWECGGVTGHLVQIADYHPPKPNVPGGDGPKINLNHKLPGNTVELGANRRVQGEVLVCDVWMNGEELPTLLSER